MPCRQLWVIKRIGADKRQAGAVLVISLIMLLLLTLIGITATGIGGLEEKMAGNLRDRSLAFQAAETALRAGEELTSSLTCPLITQVGGFYPSSASPAITDDSFWLNSSNIYTYAGVALANTTSTAQPKYIIQCVSSIPCSALSTGSVCYRVTARGTGGTTDAVVVLQSIYMR